MEDVDYFVNHKRVGKFPWSLYHDPLQDSLLEFLGDISDRNSIPKVLVVGCGLLSELNELPPNLRLSCVDLDPRVVENVGKIKDPRIVHTAVVQAGAIDLQPPMKFDAIYLKEVIEHIHDPLSYVRMLKDLLAPGGQVWMSTPNYGEPWLPFLENTALEFVARISGFSRKHIHPVKFSKTTLLDLLQVGGFQDVSVNVVARRLALVATAAL